MDPTLQHDYQKPRFEFGKHPSFGESVPQVTSVGGEPAAEDGESPEDQWVVRDETTFNFNCIPRYSVNEANTQKFEQHSTGVQHVDGAWPAEVKTNEFVDQQRYLRRIKNDAVYQNTVMKLLKNADVATKQNNTINLFEHYFEKDPLIIEEGGPEEPVEFSSEPPSCRTVAVFRDPNEIKRSATDISWHPDAPNKMAVAYSILQFQQMPEKMEKNSYIWDINNPNSPDAELQPSSPLVSLKYNPRQTDHLVGGCYNGLVSFWDLRKGAAPVETSILEKSHHDPVYKVFWIQSRTGNEVCSVSTCGRLLWWDTRLLTNGPIDEMILDNGDGVTFGGTSMEYRSDAGATKYMVGTEQGQSILVDRKASKDKGSQKSIKQVYGQDAYKHHGPVYSIERNPFNLKYFLTTGDWTSKIWMEDIKVPLLTTPCSSSRLTGACWSPTRPGVFFTTKRNGTLDVWDYYSKQNSPTFSTKIGDFSISSIAVQSGGKLLACGSEEGTTSVLQLSSALSNQQPHEKQMMAELFERETKREKNLEMRIIQKNREIKEKAREAAHVKEEFDPEAEWDEIMQQKIKEAEDAFFATIKKSEGEEEKAAAEEQKTSEPAAPAGY